MPDVRVAPERLAGWVGRFTTSHGEVSWSVRAAEEETSPSSYLLTAADGSWARLTSWQDAVAPGPERLGEWAVPPPLLVLLVRRGGYAVAVVAPSGGLLASKVGTRHVQSRTAAGGWSQQRFARRRANQADALVEAAAGHAARVLEQGRAALAGAGHGGGASPPRVGGLVLGGDRLLWTQTLEELATGADAWVADLPRRELPGLPDPRRAVLEDAVARGRAVLVEVVNA